MIDWILGLFKTYPEVFAGAAGVVVSITLSEVLRFVYFPKDWDNTDAWRAIVPINFFCCFAVSHSLWHFLDPSDGRGLRIIGCICFAILSLGLHLGGQRYVLHRWPWALPDVH